VNPVIIDVKNVTEKSVIVLNVLILTEKITKNVHVKMDSMMMVIMPNVTNVTAFAKPVIKKELVSLVLLIELKTHHIVHVNQVNMIAKKTDLVVNVLINVMNVKMMIKNVLLVLLTDKTIHQPVPVNTDGLKSVENVLNVMNKDVKLVLVPFLTVLPVNLIEKLLHQNVHVLMVNMKKKITLVMIVIHNVKLVKKKAKTVLNVQVLELINQVVYVQMDTLKKLIKLVTNVIQNVKLVLKTDLNVLLVLMTELMIKIKTVHVLMVNMKKVKNVTIVHTNVKLVTKMPMIVPNVLMIPDLQNQLVIVKPCLMTSKKRNVHLVTKNVLNVKNLTKNVPNVTKPELKILIHHAHVNLTNMLIATKNVKIVLSDVKLVILKLINVNLVLISELQLLDVLVQKNIMK